MSWFVDTFVRDARRTRGRGNVAFIDGQNLYLGTKEDGWKVDHGRFRKCLKRKYGVKEAYYFMGYKDPKYQGLYDGLTRAGFTVRFKENTVDSRSERKGNVDVYIVFEVMERMAERPDSFDKVVLVSGDGDYLRMVDYLIAKGKFEKILFPNARFASSLYKKLRNTYGLTLSTIRKNIERL